MNNTSPLEALQDQVWNFAHFYVVSDAFDGLLCLNQLVFFSVIVVIFP